MLISHQLLQGEPRASQASSITIECNYDECPLFAEHRCVCRDSVYCPYGTVFLSPGPNFRDKDHAHWCKQKLKCYQAVPCLDPAARKLAFIGDYIYLPYRGLGAPYLWPEFPEFISVRDWTFQWVSRWVPGQPLLLSHIRELDPRMWGKLLAADPELFDELNYVGRRAYLQTLNTPITFRGPIDKVVKWTWDGQQLTSSWEIAVEADTLVTVEHNAWVNDNTKFVD